MYGSHLKENCWTLYPDKRPKFNTPRKKRRGKERGRSRTKSGEKEERRKGRENSPHQTRVNRITDQLTDRDSDESEKEASVKELEREYLEAKEKAKATKDKYEKQVRREIRRVRTGNAGDIFTDEISEAQYNQMEREATRGPSRRQRRVKRCSQSSEEKRSSTSRGAASTFQGQSPGLGGRTHDSSVKEKEDKVETEDMVGR